MANSLQQDSAVSIGPGWLLRLLLALSIASHSADGFHYLQSNVVLAMYRTSATGSGGIALPNNKNVCPQVRPMRNFQLPELMGGWHVIQYYASSEEAAEYSCMRCVFEMSAAGQVVMNFTYQFEDDPDRERLRGNITWNVPDKAIPSHWVHAEDTYEGVYNTFVLDTDGEGWALIMHCAEKSKSPRYLSALLLSRQPQLGANVLSFLRDKLPQYDIDLELVFNIQQTECEPLPRKSFGKADGPIVAFN